MKEAFGTLKKAAGIEAFFRKLEEGNDFSIALQAEFALMEKVALPLFVHKKESDQLGKHQNWSKEKHIFSATGAILLDLGVDAITVILTLQKAYVQALILKFAYNLGVEIVPEKVSNLKNKFNCKKKT